MSATAQASAAFNPRQPFSRAEGRAADLTAEMLLRRRFHKIFWDTYVPRGVHITPLLRAKAVIRLVPSGSYISHPLLAGLPEPRVNLIIRAPDSSWRRLYGMAYDDIRLILEYDGRQHAEDTHRWLTDISRREELDQIRWRLVIITSDGIYREPLRTLERI